jgi:hypothetical protein
MSTAASRPPFRLWQVWVDRPLPPREPPPRALLAAVDRDARVAPPAVQAQRQRLRPARWPQLPAKDRVVRKDRGVRKALVARKDRVVRKRWVARRPAPAKPQQLPRLPRHVVVPVGAKAAARARPRRCRSCRDSRASRSPSSRQRWGSSRTTSTECFPGSSRKRRWRRKAAAGTSNPSLVALLALPSPTGDRSTRFPVGHTAREWGHLGEWGHLSGTTSA